MSTLKVNAITDASGGNTATINSMTPTADSLQGFRNRIINGDMRIDQRNAGAAFTPASGATTYTLDRWNVYRAGTGVITVQRSTTAPAGFNNSALITVTTADSSLGATDQYNFAQFIEGFNVADLGFGTASAKSVTLSFVVRSSLTGTFAGGLTNSDGSRSYVFTYTINSANTFEEKTVTIPGDTSGTWATDNSRSFRVIFDLGGGSNQQTTAGSWVSSYAYATSGSVKLISTLNATFYITGVQLEVGSVATPFERRPYGTELALCQRYFQNYSSGDYSFTFSGDCTTGNTYYLTVAVPPLRTTPTLTITRSATSGFATPAAGTMNTSGNNLVVSAACNSTGARRYFQFDCTLSAEL